MQWEVRRGWEGGKGHAMINICKLFTLYAKTRIGCHKNHTCTLVHSIGFVYSIGIGA